MATDEVFDLDALESEGTPFPFRFGGEDYQLPASLDVRATIAFSEGRLTDGMAMLLGDEQWERLLASEAVFDQARFEALFDAYMAHLGVDAGKSAASSRSSASTAGQSKRTSKGSTALR